MTRAVGAALVLVLAAAPAAAGRKRTLHLPAPKLARSLTVDESEWALRPSKRLVAAGPVRIRVYNRGEDDHDLAVVDGSGREQSVYLAPGTSGTLQVTLPPGAWKLYCSLFAGSPDSHEALGMAAVIRAKRAPARRATTARP
jgi:plastocyanin